MSQRTSLAVRAAAATGLLRERISKGRATGLILPLLILAVWETATHRQWISKVFLPSPERTVTSLVDMLLNQNYLMDFLNGTA